MIYLDKRDVAIKEVSSLGDSKSILRDVHVELERSSEPLVDLVDVSFCVGNVLCTSFL